MFYAKSTNGFYDVALHGSNIPKDAVEISIDLWNSLLLEQENGKVISSDESGKPIAIDRPAKTKDEIVAYYRKTAQDNLESVAKSWGYESMIMALSFMNSTNPQFKADAEALNKWRDDYWTAVNAGLSGDIQVTINDFVDALPAAPNRQTV